MSASENKAVILIHGILRSKASMRHIEKALQNCGYKTLNINYPSRKFEIEEIRELIHSEITEFQLQNQNCTFNFVVHSMGGLVLRSYLKKYPVKNLGRIIFIATPQNGSEVADWLKNFWLFKKIFGPAGQQLITKNNNSEIFGIPDCEFAVIAGNKTLDPIASKIIGQENDGRVSIESTKLQGMKAHIILPANHTFIVKNKNTIKNIISFLNSGSF